MKVVEYFDYYVDPGEVVSKGDVLVKKTEIIKIKPFRGKAPIDTQSFNPTTAGRVYFFDINGKLTIVISHETDRIEWIADWLNNL